jgi:hypothetical protein
VTVVVDSVLVTNTLLSRIFLIKSFKKWQDVRTTEVVDIVIKEVKIEVYFLKAANALKESFVFFVDH